MNSFSLPGLKEAFLQPGALFFILAFVGGLLNFFSPCTLPVLPLFLGYLSGVSLESLKTQKQAQRQVFYHTLFFVLGLVVVYSLMGAMVGLLGGLVFVKAKYLFLRISGFLLIIFGLYTLHLIKIPFLGRERRIQVKFKRLNYFTSLVQGAAFSLLWSPCSGPVLLGVLFMAETFESIQKSTLTMLFFTLGMGIPLILTGLLTSRVAFLIREKSYYLSILNKFTGIFLMGIGFLLLTKNWHLFSGLTSGLSTVLMDLFR